MLFGLSIDHAGKPGRWVNDRGAGADLDGDGVIEIHEREAMLTPYIALETHYRLLELGHDVIIFADGLYSERHKRANAYKVDAYVAEHLNAGGGDYGAAFYDHRSKRGPALAARIAEVLGDFCDELGATKAIKSEPAPHWTGNAYNTIKGLGAPVGICYEPFFLDSVDHRPLTEPAGLKRCGAALAVALDQWSKL